MNKANWSSSFFYSFFRFSIIYSLSLSCSSILFLYLSSVYFICNSISSSVAMIYVMMQLPWKLIAHEDWWWLNLLWLMQDRLIEPILNTSYVRFLRHNYQSNWEIKAICISWALPSLFTCFQSYFIISLWSLRSHIAQFRTIRFYLLMHSALAGSVLLWMPVYLISYDPSKGFKLSSDNAENIVSCYFLNTEW